MERVVLDRLERKLDERVKERFPDGVIQRVELQHGEGQAVEPGELLVRVFIGPAGAPETREQSMKAWENELKGWEKLWKELSERLPEVRRAEGIFDDSGDNKPRGMMQGGQLA